MIQIKQELNKDKKTLFKIIKDKTVLYITSDESDRLCTQVDELRVGTFREDKISELELKIFDLELKIFDLENTIEDKDLEIQSLEDELSNLEA